MPPPKPTRRAAGTPAGGVVLWSATPVEVPGLAETLAEALGLAPFAHHPFAVGGPLAEHAEGWAVADRAKREEALRQALGGWSAISVPCPAPDDLMTPSFAGAASKAGFRHVVLHQREPLARLGVLAAGAAPAKAASAGGLRELVQRERHLTLLGARLRRLLTSPAHKRRFVAIEDLMDDGATTDEGVPVWQDLARFVGATPPLAEAQAQVRQRLAAHLAPIVKLPEAVAERLHLESQWLLGLEAPPSFLKADVEAVEGEAATEAGVAVVQLNLQHRAMLVGDKVQLSGVVVAASPQETDRLELLQGGRTTALEWHQPSPMLKARQPDLAGSDRARFKAATLACDPSSPAVLQLRSAPPSSRKGTAAAGKSVRPVARVAFAPAGRAPVNGAIYLARWSIGYQAIPKVACTSIKEALFRLATGKPFSAELGGAERYIHDYFYHRANDVSGARWRFLVVRDPIKRFLSAFSNRVLHFKELSREYIAGQRVAASLDMASFPFEPTLDEFVERFDLYRQVPTINHHFRPMSEFVAPLSAFDRVYAFEEMKALAADLSRMTGESFELPHTQKGGPKLSASQVSAATMKRLLEIYAEDYRLVGHLYQPPSGG